MKKVIQIFLGIVMAAAAGSSGAACYATGTVAAFYRTPTLPIFNAAAFNDLPDGTVLYSYVLDKFDVGGLSTSFTGCAGQTLRIGLAGTPGPYNTMESGIPGIGGRVTWTGDGYGLPTGYLPQNTTSNLSNSFLFSWNSGVITVEFVKTGPLLAGSYSLVSRWITIQPPDGSVQAFAGFRGPSGNTSPIVIVKNNPTCRVSSPSMQVPLGKVAISKFSGVGSTSPQSQSFNIQLACSGGDAGNSTKVFTTLTDQTNPANRSDTLSLASGSTASGVGIQVLSGTTVIKYGPDSAADGNTNQWQAGSTENGTFNIPLTARYVQMASQITPGQANGLVTFTMNYQ